MSEEDTRTSGEKSRDAKTPEQMEEAGKMTVVQSEDDPIKFKIAGTTQVGQKFAEIKDSIESAVARAQANYQYVMLRFLLGKKTATIAEIAKELQRWNSDDGNSRNFFERVPVYGSVMMKKLTDEGGTYDSGNSPSSFRFTLSGYNKLNFVERHELMKLCKEKIVLWQNEHNEGTIPHAAAEFVPLTDKQEIKEAHDKVVSALTAASTKEKEFKAYKMNGKGHWLDQHGIFFYTADPTTITENHYWDVFGTREPTWDREGLATTSKGVVGDWILEINPPIENSWKPYGQFLKDEDGRIYYTHNGKINVPKSRDGSRFDDIYAGLGIKTSRYADGKKHASQIIISDLESPDFVYDVADYVKEVEDFRNFVETPEYQALGEEEPTEYWMIRAGGEIKSKGLSAGWDWENQKKRKIAAIHYYSVDLSECTAGDGILSEDKVKQKVDKIRKDDGRPELTQGQWSAEYGQLKKIFSVNRTSGKCRIFVVGKNKDLLGFGDATSQYEYKEGLPNPHAINMEWIDTDKRELPEKFRMSGFNRSIKELTSEDYDQIMTQQPGSQSGNGGGQPGGDPCAEWDKYDDVLKKERNMILYGPPGTGKTWTAREIAECMCDGNLSGQTYEDSLIAKFTQNAREAGFDVSKPEELTKAQKIYTLTKDGIRHIVGFHKADVKDKPDVSYFQVGNTEIKKFEDNESEYGAGGNFLVVFKEQVKRFVCLPYEVEQNLSEFVSNGTGEGGWDPEGKKKHSVHNLFFNRDRAWFKMPSTKEEEAEGEEDVTEYLGTWDAIDVGIKHDCIFQVTFHPSYSYEDFIEGFRPDIGDNGAVTISPAGTTWPYVSRGQPMTGGGASQYKLAEGIFRKACEHARNHPDGKTVLLIDEINRGNIPKIFGELITLVEKDKRKKKYALSLTYSGDEFYVPDNLYIIGTMNTADKSLVQMDDALKRRFAFEELLPDIPALREHLNDENIQNANEYADILACINEKILGHDNERSKKLYRDRQIGHSYFWKIESDDDLRHVIKYKIIPLLQDYFFDDYGKIRKVLGLADDEFAFIGEDNRPTELVSGTGSAEELRKELLKLCKKGSETQEDNSGTDKTS